MKIALRHGYIDVYEIVVGIEPCPDFIKSYIVIDRSSLRGIIVDPGPRSKCHRVEKAVEDLVSQGIAIELVLVTHIHLDHYSAAPTIAKKFNIPVLLHPRGVKHAIDPSKLWRASLEVLGNEAVELGEPEPLDPSLVRETRDGEVVRVGNLEIEVIHTPGHAPHHQSFVIDSLILFSGDAVGGYDPELDIVFPSSPPGLRYDIYVDSIKNKILSKSFSYLAPTHKGIAIDGKKTTVRHLEQIEKWFEEVARLVKKGEEASLEKLARVDMDLARYLDHAPRSSRCRRIGIAFERSLRAIVEEVHRLGKV